jgi:hypothetical protein
MKQNYFPIRRRIFEQTVFFITIKAENGGGVFLKVSGVFPARSGRFA